MDETTWYVLRRKAPAEDGGRYYAFGGPISKSLAKADVRESQEAANAVRVVCLLDQDSWEALSVREAAAKDEEQGL